MKEQKPKPKIEKEKAFEIPPAARAMAKSIGLDVDAIVKGASENKARLENLEKAVVEIANHIKDSDEKLAPLVNAIQQAEAARAQASTTAVGNPAPQGQPGMGSLLQLLPQLLGGGGGGSMWDEEMQGLMKDLVRSSISSAKEERSLSRSIAQAVVNNIAGKAAKNVIDASGG